MTVLIPRFSGFHPEIVDKGYAPEMSPSALRLYLFLMWKSDRYSTRKFQATDGEIAEAVGVSTRALTGARVKLTRMGIVLCEKSPGEEYTYTLCDLNTGKPYPGPPNVRPPYKKKETGTGTLSAIKPALIPDNSLPDNSGTDFDFGYNTSSENVAISPSDYNPFRQS